MTTQDKDYEWFVENYDSLFKQYGTAYLVIKNKAVIGTYPNCAEAVRETAKSHNPGTFIVQYCDGTEDAYVAHITSMCFGERKIA